MSSAQAQDQVQGRFFLNVVIGQSAAIFELLAGKNESLLIGRDALLVLNFGLDVVDRVAGFHIQRDGFTRERLDKDLVVRACMRVCVRA